MGENTPCEEPSPRGRPCVRAGQEVPSCPLASSHLCGLWAAPSVTCRPALPGLSRLSRGTPRCPDHQFLVNGDCRHKLLSVSELPGQLAGPPRAPWDCTPQPHPTGHPFPPPFIQAFGLSWPPPSGKPAWTQSPTSVLCFPMEVWTPASNWQPDRPLDSRGAALAASVSPSV